MYVYTHMSWCVPGRRELQCTFEVGTCDFHSVPDLGGTWVRFRGPLPTALTGPSGDHTGGDGKYDDRIGQMDAFLRTTFSNAYLLMEIIIFWLVFLV